MFHITHRCLTHHSSSAPGTANPDMRIKSLEDEIQGKAPLADASLESSLSAVSLTPKPPARPAYGTVGNRPILWANHMALLTKPGAEIFKYEVKVTPAVNGPKLRQVVRLLLQDTFFNAYRNKLATDLHVNMLFCERLPQDGKQFGIRYVVEHELLPAGTPVTHTVGLVYRQTYRVGELIKHLSSAVAGTEPFVHKNDVIKAFNLIFAQYGRVTNPNLLALKNQVYSFAAGTPTQSLHSGLHAVRGYFFSVRSATGSLLLNVNVAHGAFYDATTLVNLIERRMLVIHDSMPRLDQFLTRLKVITHHLTDKRNKKIPRVYTLKGLASPSDGRRPKKDEAPMANPPRVPHLGAGPHEAQFFWDKDGEERYVTVEEFSQRGMSFHYPVDKLRSKTCRVRDTLD